MFPDLDGGRRRRSRRRFAIPLVLTLLIVLAWWISNLSQDSLTSADFIQELQEIADGQATRAESFRQLYVDTSVNLVGRESLSVTIDQAITEIDRDLDTVAALGELPDDAIEARILMELALSRWRRGLAEFKDAGLRLSDPSEVTARADFQLAIVDLDMGDALYADFQVEVVELRDRIGVQGAPFPDVVFIEPAMSFSESVSRLSEALRTNPAMASQQVLEIATVRFDPDFTGATNGDGVPLLPNTESVTIEVVVRNAGTDLEEDLTLQLRLVVGQLEQLFEAAPVSSINPSGSTAIQFGPLALEDGLTYRLDLSLLQSAGVTIAVESQDFAVNPPAS